jgi:hypothetical protein
LAYVGRVAETKLRNATPFAEGPEFIIRDRDDKYGSELDREPPRMSTGANTGN